MYDYVDGKVDWMAFGLPVEGDDGPFLGEGVATVPTCDVAGNVTDARQLLDRSGDDAVVLVSPGGLAVGEVDRAALEGQADDVALLDVLHPVPSTVRPSVTVSSVAEAGGGAPLVTTSDGRLLGRTSVEATGDHQHEGDEHEGHDHEGHDHGTPPFDLERYETELTEVMHDVEAHFGEHDPSAEELRSFLQDRLVAEGKSPEEAEQLLDEMGVGEAD